jgi:hypothetical protein
MGSTSSSPSRWTARRPGRRGQVAEPQILLDRIGALADVGAQGMFFVLPRLADSDSIERFGEVIRRVNGEPAGEARLAQPVGA